MAAAPARATVSATAAIRFLGLAAVVVALAHVHLSGRPSTLCTLRALTGVPCPLCGGTTAAVRLGHADVRGALAASPLAVLAAAVFALGPLAVRPLPIGSLALAHSRLLASRTRVTQVPVLAWVAAIAVLSECWQLARFGFL